MDEWMRTERWQNKYYKEKLSTWGKTFPVPLCQPQILPGLAWDWIQTSNVSGTWLTTLSVVQPWEIDNGKTFRE